MTQAPDLPILNDPAVPSHHLLGDGSATAIETVVSSAEATVVRSRAAQTTYHPGRSLTVRHEVTVRWADGTHTDESIVLSAGRKAPHNAVKLTDDEVRVIGWRVPDDPWLPGLALALSPSATSGLFEQLDLPFEDLVTKLRAYRPGRRAVVEVTGSGARAFVKIVPPTKVERLHRQHEALAGRLPVPASFGWSGEDGIVVLQALPGTTLRQAILAGVDLPGPGELLDTLDLLPVLQDGETADVAVDWRAHAFAAILGKVTPDLDRRLLALADGLRPYETRASRDPVVPVHGDFYEAQLLVDGGRITGLLDVDTFGAGRRVNDLATMIGHLSVLALGSQKRTTIERYATRLLGRFDREVDTAVLRAGTAAVVLGLATGPFRVLEPNWRQRTEARVALAERWLESAHKLG